MKKKIFLPFAFFLLMGMVACSSEESSKANSSSETPKMERKTPAEIGQQISSAAQKRLGKNLMNAIKEGGHAHAVSYCRVAATSITDSVANQFDARVSRVSDKRRNPRNAANDQELEYISYYKQALSNEEDWEAKVVSSKQGYTYYTPILTQPLCLNCHGDPGTDIQEETLARLRSDYPQDQAVGYGIGEIRGLWKVEWENE